MAPRASRLIAAALLGTSLLAVTACGSDGSSSSADAAPAATTATPATAAPQASATTAAPSVDATAPAATTGDVTSPPASAGGKVNINQASVTELEAAFDAVGVTNARRWAKEVEEYRPYPKDPEYAKLRQELGKYNIAPDMLELIISTLEY